MSYRLRDEDHKAIFEIASELREGLSYPQDQQLATYGTDGLRLLADRIVGILNTLEYGNHVLIM